MARLAKNGFLDRFRTLGESKALKPVVLPPVRSQQLFQNSRRVEGVEAVRRNAKTRRSVCFRTLGESKALKQQRIAYIEFSLQFQNSRRVEGVEAGFVGQIRFLSTSVSELSASRRR